MTVEEMSTRVRVVAYLTLLLAVFALAVAAGKVADLKGGGFTPAPTTNHSTTNQQHGESH